MVAADDYCCCSRDYWFYVLRGWSVEVVMGVRVSGVVVREAGLVVRFAPWELHGFPIYLQPRKHKRNVTYWFLAILSCTKFDHYINVLNIK